MSFCSVTRNPNTGQKQQQQKSLSNKLSDANCGTQHTGRPLDCRGFFWCEQSRPVPHNRGYSRAVWAWLQSVCIAALRITHTDTHTECRYAAVELQLLDEVMRTAHERDGSSSAVTVTGWQGAQKSHEPALSVFTGITWLDYLQKCTKKKKQKKKLTCHGEQ